MTRKAICEAIQRRLAGGEPSNDFSPTLSEINLGWVDQAVAQAAMKNYTESASLDIEFVADAFTATYKVPLTIESVSGFYTGTLPQMAIAVPRGYDITSVQVVGNTGYSKSLVRVTPQQLDYYKYLPSPPGASFWWPEGNIIYVDSANALSGRILSVRMTGSAGKRELTDELLCPLDFIPMVIDWVLAHFQPRPHDVSDDGLNVP